MPHLGLFFSLDVLLVWLRPGCGCDHPHLESTLNLSRIDGVAIGQRLAPVARSQLDVDYAIPWLSSFWLLRL